MWKKVFLFKLYSFIMTNTSKTIVWIREIIVNFLTLLFFLTVFLKGNFLCLCLGFVFFSGNSGPAAQ